MSLLQPRRGLAALEGLLHAAAVAYACSAPLLPVVAAAPLDWGKMLRDAPPPPLLEDVAPRAAAPAAAATAIRGMPAPQGMTHLGPPRRSAQGLAAVAAEVSAAVRAVVGEDVPPQASLMESGLDSL
eukprot:297103-Chlamydomonas_euryale.AAC.1